jgi:hypothetical protein
VWVTRGFHRHLKPMVADPDVYSNVNGFSTAFILLPSALP